MQTAGFPAGTTLSVGSGALPAGVTFNPANGVLAGTPANGTNSTYYLTLDATNLSGTTSQNFILNVLLPVAASRSYNFVPSLTAPTVPGYTNALPTDVEAINGDGWTSTVQAYNTGGSDGTAPTGLVEDFDWGTNVTQTLQLAGTPGETYSLRLYVGDSRSINGGYSMLVRAYDSTTATNALPAFTPVSTYVAGLQHGGAERDRRAADGHPAASSTWTSRACRRRPAATATGCWTA